MDAGAASATSTALHCRCSFMMCCAHPRFILFHSPLFLTSQVVLRLGLLVAAGMTAKKALSPYAQPYVRGFFDYCGLRPAGEFFSTA